MMADHIGLALIAIGQPGGVSLSLSQNGTINLSEKTVKQEPKIHVPWLWLMSLFFSVALRQRQCDESYGPSPPPPYTA
jgi:hypothetical protein